MEGSPYEFQDIAFKNTKASDFSNVTVKSVPLDNSWGQNEFLKKLFCFEKGMLSTFLVVHEEYLNRTNLKRYWVDSFFKSL